jgi:general secretion pathway protein I
MVKRLIAKRSCFEPGFTLVEVLVALAVVSLVLVALLGSMQSVVASATIIHDRTLANWIAVDKVTELRLSTEFPAEGETSGEVEMADIEWIYFVDVKAESILADVRTITVKVATVEQPEIILAAVSGTVNAPTAEGGRLNGTSAVVRSARSGVRPATTIGDSQ